MDRKASVVWNGTLREGTGTLSTESGVLNNTQYSFRTRFLQGIGTNPDELIAASLGGCFSMALSNELGLSGFHPQRMVGAVPVSSREGHQTIAPLFDDLICLLQLEEFINAGRWYSDFSRPEDKDVGDLL